MTGIESPDNAAIALELAAEIAAMLAALTLCFLLMLAYHNPFRPSWMHKEVTSSLILMVALTVLIMAVAWFMKGLLGIGVDPLGALALAATVLGLMAWSLWKGLRIASDETGVDWPPRSNRQADCGRLPW